MTTQQPNNTTTRQRNNTTTQQRNNTTTQQHDNATTQEVFEVGLVPSLLKERKNVSWVFDVSCVLILRLFWLSDSD
jgi:hypothetical protein